MKYDGENIYIDGKKYNFNGLKVNEVVWHLQEIASPEQLLTLHESDMQVYTMPKHIGTMSLVEGTDFDALLIDKYIFRYTKLKESDRNDVQEYINKYAYATALLKLNECSNVIGSGLGTIPHVFNEEEVYTYMSRTYDKLLENVYVSKEKGRLVESINGVKVLEGEEGYIKEVKGKRIIENWKNTFNKNKLKEYNLVKTSIDANNNLVVQLNDKQGTLFECVYTNSSKMLVETGLNLRCFLKPSNLIESYRIGKLDEYHQPFTISEAGILSYDIEDGKIKLGVLDSYRNRGVIYLTTKIPADEFLKKYKNRLDSILKAYTFSERVSETSQWLNDAELDIESMSKIKSREIVPDDDEYVGLPYQVNGFTPVSLDGGDVVIPDRKGKGTFKVVCKDKTGKLFNITFKYKRNEPIQEFIADINEEADEYDFNSPSETSDFFRTLCYYGDAKRSYPLGISTKDRNYKKDIQESAEGVQVSDIAPKVDQNVGGLIKVKMKKKKKSKEPFNASDLLLNTINEQDAFYGARGFVKDELGRYHFNDYYLVEGKVVHKSKLKEEFWHEDGEKEYKGVKISVETSDKGKKCYIPLRSDNFIPEKGTQFFNLKQAKDYIDSKLGLKDK